MTVENETTRTPWEILGEDVIDGVPVTEISSGEFGTPDFESIACVQSEFDPKTQEFVMTEKSRGWAKLIVRAVNCHEDLVDALKYARRFLKPGDVDTAYIDRVIALASGDAS